jgi:hypothetical protein
LPRGYTSLIVAISFMGGLELTVLGILGEYLGAVFDEVKRRPLYIIDEVIGPHRSSQRLCIGDRGKAAPEQTGVRRGVSRRFQSRGHGRGGKGRL